MPWAYLASFGLVIGVPASLALILCYGKSQRGGDDKPKGHLTVYGGWIYSSLGFSYSHYSATKRMAPYWECVRQVRKASLIAVSLFIDDRKIQLNCGLLLLVFITMVAWCRPFRRLLKGYNIMETVSISVVAMTEILGCIDELSEHQSCEEPSAASILIVGSNVGIILVLVACLAVEAYWRATLPSRPEESAALKQWERLIGYALDARIQDRIKRNRTSIKFHETERLQTLHRLTQAHFTEPSLDDGEVSPTDWQREIEMASVPSTAEHVLTVVNPLHDNPLSAPRSYSHLHRSSATMR